MCFTVSAKGSVKELNERYNAINETPELHQQYYKLSGFNPVARPIKDFPKLPVLTASENKIFNYMQWGLIPWDASLGRVKDFIKYNLNAKATTVLKKQLGDPLFASKRCIVPITGFFESRHCNTVKYPYLIGLKNEPIFSVAGIYDIWKDPESGINIKSFSILTTEANPLMAKIHNSKLRMPVILPREKELLWISPQLTKGDWEELLQPIDDCIMEAYTIDKKANNNKIDSNFPEILNPVTYPELEILDSN